MFRTSIRHFTRKSPLGFKNTALIILKMVKKSAKVELMDYFYKLDAELFSPSRQALSKAREKISFRLFQDFFKKTCELALTGENARAFKGYRLFAVDGTSFVVGFLEKLQKHFGKSTCVPGKAMCRIGGIVDVLNDCIVDAIVSPYKTGERALAMEQINQLKDIANALFLFDRGYWSVDLIESIIGNGQKFLMRVASNNEKAALSSFNGSLRHYSFTLPGGEREILVTNISAEEMTDEELAWLYTKRWGVETKYLELKDRLQIDTFSGESANTVLQDIYSTLYISNFVAFVCFEADEMIAEKMQGKDNKYDQKSNRSICISVVRSRFIDICLMEDPGKRDKALVKLYAEISRCVIQVKKSKPRQRKARLSRFPKKRHANSLF